MPFPAPRCCQRNLRVKSILLQKRTALKKPRAMIKTRLRTKGARSRLKSIQKLEMRIKLTAKKSGKSRHL